MGGLKLAYYVSCWGWASDPSGEGWGLKAPLPPYLAVLWPRGWGLCQTRGPLEKEGLPDPGLERREGFLEAVAPAWG